MNSTATCMYDIIFCSLPFSSLDQIYSAPAILKGTVTEKGYRSKTVDFGCELFKICDKNPDTFHHTQKYFLSDAEFDTRATTDTIEKFYSYVLHYLKQHSTRYLGISVFTFWTHRATYELLTRLKNENYPGKIVIGGLGAAVRTFRKLDHHLTPAEKHMTFGNVLMKRQLVDHVIIGDGEDAVLSLLQNQQYSNTGYQQSDRFRTPLPDYQDYDFHSYLTSKEDLGWPITGSKGCVRDCDFCDVKAHFGNYRYRGGQEIVYEMIETAKRYGVKKFHFTDSLVNGGLKPFREFLEGLAYHNQTNPDLKLSWDGHYICRPKGATPSDLYQLIKDSGGHGLTIGAESGSDHVLQSMNKKTDVESLFSELEQFKQHDITCVLLSMVGHWSESWKDFVDHCQMIIRLVPYVRCGTISALSSPLTMTILENSPSFIHSKKNNVVTSENDFMLIWKALDNPSNTFKERIYRKLIVGRLCEHLRIPTFNVVESLVMTLSGLEDRVDQINEFYRQFAPQPRNGESRNTYHDVDRFINDLVAKTILPKFTINVESNHCNGAPRFEISFNQKTLFDQLLAPGIHEISFDLDVAAHNSLVFKMTNKNKDTDFRMVDGQIIEDKNIIIHKLTIDNIDLLADQDFFYNKTSYKIGDTVSEHSHSGFWFNDSQLILQFDGLFYNWYLQNTTKNIALAQPMKFRNAFAEDYTKQLETQIVKLAEQLDQ